MNNNCEELVYSGAFKYKNEKYYLFHNKKCRKFFLKEVNGELDFVTLEEYKDIMKDVFSFGKIEKWIAHLSVPTFVKVKNKLVPFALIGTLLLSGCTTTPKPTTEQKTENEYYSTTEKELSSIEAHFSSAGIELEDVSDLNDFYCITSVSKEGPSKYNNYDFSDLRDIGYKELCTPATFRNYIDLDKKEITFDDLREVTRENENITGELEKIIIEGLDNLEKSGFNMDYSVLYYNLKKMTIEYVDEEETFGNSGIFYFETATVKINDNLKGKMTDYSKGVLLHEIIGHGSTKAYIEDKEILCTCDKHYMDLDENGAIIDFWDFGRFADEAIAQIIESKTMGGPLTEKDDPTYSSLVYGLSLFCSTLDISVEDFANYGIDLIVDKMKENGIENPYQYICYLDNKSRLVESCSTVEDFDSSVVYTTYLDELLSLGVNKEKLVEDSRAFEEFVEPFYVNELKILGYITANDSADLVQPDEITEYIENYSKKKGH